MIHRRRRSRGCGGGAFVSPNGKPFPLFTIFFYWFDLLLFDDDGDDGVVADDDTGRRSHADGGNHDGGDVPLDNVQHQMMVRVLMQIGFNFMFGLVRFGSSVQVGSRFGQSSQRKST
ncbi:hypothetical protein Hanom_Chr11g01004281 [Helianthus anomalus]